MIKKYDTEKGSAHHGDFNKIDCSFYRAGEVALVISSPPVPLSNQSPEAYANLYWPIFLGVRNKFKCQMAIEVGASQGPDHAMGIHHRYLVSMLGDLLGNPRILRYDPRKCNHWRSNYAGIDSVLHHVYIYGSTLDPDWYQLVTSQMTGSDNVECGNGDGGNDYMSPYAIGALIDLFTDEGDVVIDPMAGSNSVGAIAEKLGRRWESYETDYTRFLLSMSRFS